MLTPESEDRAASDRQERPAYAYPPVGDGEPDAGDEVVVESSRAVTDRIDMHTVDVQEMPDEAIAAAGGDPGGE